METGYKILRSQRRVKKRTRTRTGGTRRRGREKGSKNKSTIQKELLAKRELLAEGMLATEMMDQEIGRLGELMTLLYPWDEEGKQIVGKSVNAYYWASELRRLSPHARSLSIAALVCGAGGADAKRQAHHGERDDPE